MGVADLRYEFYRGDIIPPAPKWRASRAVPSGLAARLVLKGRELSARDLSAGAAGAAGTMTRG
jgi:hypothetical protein